MAKGRRRGGKVSTRQGTFEPENTAIVKHTRVGVWDLYEERHPKFIWRLPGLSTVERYGEMFQNAPYVWKMLKDISSIRNCWSLLCCFLLVQLLLSLIPAASLWYSGKLLTIVQEALESRMVDEQLLLRISAARVCCSIAKRLLKYAKSRLSFILSARMKQHFSVHLFRARARLDLPTFEDPIVQRQLEEASSSSAGSTAWDTLSMVVTAAATAVQIVSQLSVLANVLSDQLDGPLLSALSFSQSIMEHRNTFRFISEERVWAATTKNEDYIRMQGLKHVVNDMEHRKEFIAGNLAEYATSEFKQAAKRVGEDAGDYWELQRARRTRDTLSFRSILQDPLRELPQIVFTFRAVQRPASIPVSLASLNLIQSTTSSFSWTVYQFFNEFGSIADQLAAVRKLYDVEHIPNRIVDGTLPFPEDVQKVKMGIAVEFRNVSFQYPGSDRFAIRGVSFKLSPGQLCVIVGVNGSGKSTILKLITRLYDPQEGQILIDGTDIRTLKLADLRQAISVLFQDYTHFPLSIRENIALGDPARAANEEHVRRAARLGGAEAFIERLPDGLATYLDRPVRDYYAGIPEGTQTLFGRKVDFSAVRGRAGLSATSGTALSGGQMQRLAVSRTFMRSVVSEDSTVGLLLFDEPSASLDPSAEHDLFARLRELRGNKTMLFSSHRFGNLTRHADVILYMDDSAIVEGGTHDELLMRDGEYARIWKLQAQAFL
ncbi:P-loop containing nucleoside triphosphate hydrolase protein [Amylocystis lapponica]|nr:P-loop containing nucleoside triphosphate hydrolase protein [Amylocystis lapponica]